MYLSAVYQRENSLGGLSNVGITHAALASAARTYRVRNAAMSTARTNWVHALFVVASLRLTKPKGCNEFKCFQKFQPHSSNISHMLGDSTTNKRACQSDARKDLGPVCSLKVTAFRQGGKMHFNAIS